MPVTVTTPSSIPAARPRLVANQALLAVGATLFVATCAHISVPLYFTPVPVTLQTFAVLLIGLVFGPSLAFSSLALYLAEGAAGLPVFSPHGPGGIAQLFGPSGGYLLSYPFAAAAAGLIARLVRTHMAKFPTAMLAGLVSTVVVFSAGATWTAHSLHLNLFATWSFAVLPFLPGEVLKIFAAALISTKVPLWRRS